ncbi:MAG: tetratricopeptide repeat protein [Candidatus Shapirobacteria bacterium]|jgi:tetratricopeptide (TPR) repeat protein
MKCTNCQTETSDIGDLHCRKIFKNEFERLLEKWESTKAIDYFKAFLFKDPSSNEWKNNKWKKVYENMVKEEEKKEMTVLGMKIRKKQLLNERELIILKNNQKNEWLGYYHYTQYQINKDIWEQIKACSFYRDADKPDVGIKITEKINNKNPDKTALAALYTTRGGAYKDFGNYNEAIECANKAIQINKTFYPYTLLGAVYILKESFSKADECFEIAIRLGADHRLIGYEIQKASQKLSATAKKEIRGIFYKKYTAFKEPNN